MNEPTVEEIHEYYQSWYEYQLKVQCYNDIEDAIVMCIIWAFAILMLVGAGTVILWVLGI